ncbi:MAG TPA: DUF1801 domain-containing protein [Candidatus Limnocylindria bacterium]|nr:DUF1801 domain-containing protein [Candidatus Limnocylindria bacterium]
MTASRDDVAAYFATLPKDTRVELERLRKAVRSAAPGATETISYGMPTFKKDGRTIVSIAAWKGHCSLYGVGYPVLRAFATEVKPYRTERSTVSFPHDTPIPDALVRTLVRARVAALAKAAATR